MCMRLVLCHAIDQTFKKQTGKEPDWSIVKPDESLDVEFCFAVIPWTGMVLFEEGAGEKFSRENQNSIECSAKNNRNLFCFTEYWC